jgi:hypothetical protein
MSLKNSSYWRLLSDSLSDGSCRSGVNHPRSSGSSRLLRRQRFSPGSPLHTKLPQHSGRSPPHRSPLSRHSSSSCLLRQRFSPGSPLHTKLPQHGGRFLPHRSPLLLHGGGGGGGGPFGGGGGGGGPFGGGGGGGGPFGGGGGGGGEHGPSKVSRGWLARCICSAFAPTHSVCSFEGLPGGLWQIVTLFVEPGGHGPGTASAREGTSAPTRAAAKIFSARRRLRLPLARLRASSSKLWLCLGPCPGSSDIGYHLSFLVTSPMCFEQHIQSWSMVKFCP